MRKDAALTDQLQLRQALQQGRADLRALADQDQRLGMLQPLGELVDVLDMVVPDRDVMAFQFHEAIEGAYRVEIIVEDGNLHDTPLSAYFTESSSTSNMSVAFGGITPPAPRAP